MVALLFILSCGGTIERKTYIGGTTYFPLRDGRQLHYRQTENGKTTDYTMRLRYIGGRARKLYSAEIDGIRHGGLEFRSFENKVEAAMQFSLTSLYPRETLGEFRQLWIDEDVAEDSSWFDEDTGTETTFIGLVPVTVPAGTYADCYQTEVAATQELLDSLESRYERKELTDEEYTRETEAAGKIITRWFASGIGLVKEQIGSDIIRELVAVDSVGGGIIDTLAPEITPILP